MEAARGDLSTLLSLIVNASALPIEDFIDKTLGSMKYLYYIYLNKFHIVPIDMDDLVDGLMYIDIEQRIQADAMKRARSRENRSK